MIKSFKHKGLRNFFESGSSRGIQAAHSKKLRMQLAALDTAFSIEDMDIPGYQPVAGPVIRRVDLGYRSSGGDCPVQGTGGTPAPYHPG